MKKIKSLLLFLFLSLFSIALGIAQTQNFLTSSGNKLFDVNGKEVRLTGVNWFGFETALYSPHGLWTRDMKSVLQQIKDLGFNTIRVPWCNEMLNPGATINIASFGTDPYTGISPMNEEESTVTKPIELMDIFVQWCQENDIKIVLDNHSRAADGFLNEAYWYTEEYSEERWINDWKFIADRYKDYSAVVAMDLNNEPHGSTWGDSNPATDWNKAAERCGNEVLSVNPNVLIIIEGVGEFEGDSYWWGGQLMGARKYPIQLSNPEKLVYSAHEYGPEVAPQDWFTASDFPQNMPGIWTDHYHYLYEENTSPIFVGEFGIKNQDAFGGIAYTWFTEFVDFMGDIYSWTFWTMNPNSGDTGGILADDWSSVNEWKMDVLRPHFAPLIPNIVGGTSNQAPIASFTADKMQGIAPLTVAFNASGSSDPDGDTLTYAWNFGDGTIASGESISHLFEEEGTYQVTLTVSDSTLNDASTITINVTEDNQGNPVATANFSASTETAVAPAIISFDASSSSISDDSILTYDWDFGDNTFGSGIAIDHEYTEIGAYTVTLTVSNDAGVSDSVSKSILITEETNGGGNDCDFGTPLANALPTINNKAYANIYILGNNGPDLSNVTNFTINWDLPNNGLWQMSMNTNNGQPSWWNDLKSNIVSQNLNSTNPSITLSGTGFSGLDGTYDVAIDGENFVMVSISEGFTIYFSNSESAPSCEDLNKLREDTYPKISAYPNPVIDEVFINLNAPAKGTAIQLIDVTGKILKSVITDIKTQKVNMDLREFRSGIYFIKIKSETQSITKQIIKQ